MELMNSEFDAVDLEPNEILFRHGEPNDGRMFIVRSGVLSIIKQRDGTGHEVNTVTQGDPIGEVSFLTGGARTATVKAVTRCSLFSLSNESFERMVVRNPQIGLKVLRCLVARLREFEKRTGWA